MVAKETIGISPLRPAPAPPCESLLAEARGCRVCAPHLPEGPRPLLQLHPGARILIASQAPGRRAHLSGIPFGDASGDRLRDWLGIDRAVFYDAGRIAILPMGLCFPGSGASGDLPPRPECAPLWRARLLAALPKLELTLAIGAHAQRWHLGQPRLTVTQAAAQWREHWPALLPLPHPSGRNNAWFKRNPWFERELLPALKRRVAQLIAQPAGDNPGLAVSDAQPPNPHPRKQPQDALAHEPRPAAR